MKPVRITFLAILFLSLSTLFLSCQSQTAKNQADHANENKEEQAAPPKTNNSPDPQLTEKTKFGGFPYKHHRKTGGPKPYPGVFAQYHYRLFKDGKQVQSSFGTEPAPIGRMPTMEEIENNPTPILEGLMLMSEGDSLSISAGPRTDGGEYLYELVLLKIFGGSN